jgi:hypothetical protein
MQLGCHRFAVDQDSCVIAPGPRYVVGRPHSVWVVIALRQIRDGVRDALPAGFLVDTVTDSMDANLASILTPVCFGIDANIEKDMLLWG